MADANVVKEVACFVCGQKSHRADWQDGKEHACDSHSANEIVKAKKPNGPPAAASAK